MWGKEKILKILSIILFLAVIQSAIQFTLQINDISNSVERITTWKRGIKHAVWKVSEGHVSFNDWSYNEVWEVLLSAFEACNVVDIGANDGDSTLNLAEAVRNAGGRVVAFEMGPSFPMLRYNVALNPQYNIDIYHNAVSNVSETVYLTGKLSLSCHTSCHSLPLRVGGSSQDLLRL